MTFTLSPLTGAPSPGRYQIIVQDSGLNETGILHLARVPPPIVPWLSYGSNVQVALGVADVDSFAFVGQASDVISITAQSLSNCLDPAIRVFDPTGATVHSFSCNGGPPSCGTCSVNSGPLTLSVSGTYTVMVWDSGGDEAGTVNLTLNCVFSPSLSGLCPPSPTPLPCSAPPTITSVDPPVMTPTGGYSATVFGTGFCATPAPFGFSISLGGAAVPSQQVILVSSTQAQFVVPAVPPGLHPFVVSTPQGMASTMIEVRGAALSVSPAPVPRQPSDIVLRSIATNAPAFVLASSGTSGIPISPCGTTQIGFGSLIAVLSDPVNAFGASQCPTQTGSTGLWDMRNIPLPNPPLGVTVYLEAFVIDTSLATPCQFHQSNLLTVHL